MENSKTTFRPILFSTPMVQAILENRKRKTRRTKGLEKVNENPHDWKFDGISISVSIPNKKNDLKVYHSFTNIKSGEKARVFCPYNLGEIFWVRENFYTASNWDHWKPSMLKSVNVEVFYQADRDNDSISKPLHRGKTRPNIFLPKEYARIFLKIKSIRVERLHDINSDDAIKEGVDFVSGNSKKLYYDYLKSEFGLSPLFSFMTLWMKINGRTSWDSNPFVFVYEFEQIEKPLNFIV